MNALNTVIDYILRIINKFNLKIKYDYEIYPMPDLETCKGACVSYVLVC